MNDKLSDGNKGHMRFTQITNVIRQYGAGGRITPVTNQETKLIIENSATQSSRLKQSQSYRTYVYETAIIITQDRNQDFFETLRKVIIGIFST